MPDVRFREHHASGPISLQVIEGMIRGHLPATSIALTTSQLLAVESGIRHDDEAIEESAFLLSIRRTTYENVSERHEPES